MVLKLNVSQIQAETPSPLFSKSFSSGTVQDLQIVITALADYCARYLKAST